MEFFHKHKIIGKIIVIIAGLALIATSVLPFLSL